MLTRLGPLDEVRDDQEVAGIFHPLDHIDLERESGVVILTRHVGSKAVQRDAPLEADPRALSQFHAFVGIARGEARQDRLQGPRTIRAALGDLDRVGDRLRQVREQRRHLGRLLK